MNTTGIVRKGIVWSFVEGFGVKLVSTLVFFILAKLLGATQFGLVAIAYAFIEFGDILIEQGMIATLVQKENLEPSHLDTAFWINIGLGAGMFVIVFLLAPVVAGIYHEPLLSPVLRSSGLVFLIGPSGLVQVAKLTREMNFRAIARSRIISLFSGAVVSVTMAFLDYGVWALVFQKLVFISLSTLFFWIYTKWTPRLHFSLVHFRELFSFSYKMLLNNSMTYAGRSSVELLVGYFHGIEAAGIYVFCYKVFQSTIEIANSSVNKVMLPLFSSVQGDREQLVRYFYKAIDYVFIFLVPFLALIVFLSPEAIHYFFNATWAQSADLLKLVSIGGTIYMIYYYSNSVLISIGKPEAVVKFLFADVALNLILLALVGQLPLIYVGYVSIIKSFLLVPLAYWLVRQSIPITLSGVVQSLSRSLWIGCIVFLVLALTSAFIPVFSPQWVWLGVQGMIWLVTVLVALHYFMPSVTAPLLSLVALRFNRNKKKVNR